MMEIRCGKTGTERKALAQAVSEVEFEDDGHAIAWAMSRAM